jgi:putative chitinase
MITAHDLVLCTGARIDRARTFLPYLEDTMHEFEINTKPRIAAFLAQIGHESGGLHWLVELWGPTDAQRRYEMRYDLGNIAPGDGYKFRGRGLIQITGRANYRDAGLALGVDLEYHPELLGEPALASRSAGWYWGSRKLNALADAGEFEKITRKVNGGLNGYPERLGLYEAAKRTLV